MYYNHHSHLDNIFDKHWYAQKYKIYNTNNLLAISMKNLHSFRFRLKLQKNKKKYLQLFKNYLH